MRTGIGPPQGLFLLKVLMTPRINFCGKYANGIENVPSYIVPFVLL